jgi:NADH-quinone oxidoreductase subunit N
MPDITVPSLSVAALAPLIFVFGAACVGVLVEAFAPREARHAIQVGVALVGTLGGLVATLLLSGTHKVTAGGELAIDGPGLFLQAMLTGFGALSILLFAERALDPSRPGAPATGSSSPPPGCRPRSTRWPPSRSAA